MPKYHYEAKCCRYIGQPPIRLPPGVECGPGPESTVELCDLIKCADAEVRQDDQNQKRDTANTLADRQFDCPFDVDCGPGPVCTSELRDLPGCAEAGVCQESPERKRSADKYVVHPVCQVCIVGDNGIPVCGCATSGEGVERRDTEKRCPQYCIFTEDGQTLCGCAAQTYEDSNQGTEPKA